MQSDEVSQKELVALIEERGGNVFKRFEQDIFSGIENPKLLSILEYVKNRSSRHLPKQVQRDREARRVLRVISQHRCPSSAGV